MDDRNNSFSRDALSIDAHVSSTYETTGSDVEIVPLAAPPSIPEYEKVVADAKSAPANDTHRNDDPLAIDSSMADPSLFPVAIKVLPEKRTRWTLVVSAAAAAAAIALGIGAVARQSMQQAARDTIASAAPARIARAAARPTPSADAITSTAILTTSPSEQPAVALPSAAIVTPEIASEPRRVTGSTRRVAANRGARTTAAAIPAPSSPPAATPSEPVVARAVAPEARSEGSASCRAECHADVNCLLRCFEPMSTRPSDNTPRAALPTPPATPHDAPTQSEVANALTAINPALHECTGGATGRTALTINFANSGRPTTVNVGLPYAGTPIGSCIARAVRGVRVEPFTQPTYQAAISYRIP